MIKTIVAISIFAIASAFAADELIITKELLAGDSALISAISHGTFIDSNIGDAKILRFIHLIPKIGGGLYSGIGCMGRGIKKIHPSVKIDNGEHITDFFGMSDCKTWFGIHLNIFTPLAGVATQKTFGIVKNPDGIFESKLILGFEALIDFFHDNINSNLLSGIIAKGIPSHIIIHRLIKKFGLILSI